MPAPTLAGMLRPTTSSTITTPTASFSVSATDRTRPFLLLHGGGGPATMAGFASLLAERTHARVLLPTHPGFAGTPRPEGLDSTRALAAAYVELIEELDLADLTLIGNSFGGWLAAEIALLGSPRVRGAVIVDAIGLEVVGHPVTDVRGLAPAELRELSFHDPRKAQTPSAGRPGQDGRSGQPGQPPAGPGPDVTALMAYAGPDMCDPTLAGRLSELDLPVQVVWGASDGIVSIAHAHAWADGLPMSSLTVIGDSGHLPQLETPEELLGAILGSGA